MASHKDRRRAVTHNTMKRRLNQAPPNRRGDSSQFLKRTTDYFVRHYLPPFLGDSNMRLVVLCTLIFLVSFWLLRFFSPAASRPFGKKTSVSSDHGRCVWLRPHSPLPTATGPLPQDGGNSGRPAGLKPVSQPPSPPAPILCDLQSSILATVTAPFSAL